jgi:phospholipid/cholesterol/gamma-HCH transport system substrate-binding protein
VTKLALDKHDPRKIETLIAVDRGAPLRADVKVTLEFQGLTGLTEVSPAGGSADAAPIVADGGEPPTPLCRSERPAPM